MSSRIYTGPEWPEAMEVYEPGDRVMLVVTRNEVDHGGDAHEILAPAVVKKAIVKSTRVLVDDEVHVHWPDANYELMLLGPTDEMNGRTAKAYHAALYRNELDFVQKVLGPGSLLLLRSQLNQDRDP